MFFFPFSSKKYFLFSRTCDTKFNDLNLANLPKSIESKLKKVLGNNILPHLDKAATPERKCSHKDADSEFVKKIVKRHQDYLNLILFQVKDGN